MTGPDEGHPDPDGGRALVMAALQVEGSLLAIALVLGWMGLRDPSQSLTRLDWRTDLLPGLLWGSAGAVPLIGLSLWAAWSRLEFFRQMQGVIGETLLPLVRQCDWAGIVIVAILAGFGEELLFRWSLQGGINRILSGGLAPAGAMMVAPVLAAVLFGLCHFANWQYFVVATLCGLWLGGLMIASGTWLAAALAHTLVDLVALTQLKLAPTEDPQAGGDSGAS